MRKFLLLCLSFVMCLCMCGCTREADTVRSKTLEIAMAGNEVLALQIPEDWKMAEQDGSYYWSFNDGKVTIYKTKAPVSLGDKKDNCYYSNNSVSRNFKDYTITIKAPKKELDTAGALLNKSSTFVRTVLQYKERGVLNLPKYQDYPMDMTKNGLYMPLQYNEVSNDIFTACNSIKGNSFITCWIMNYRLEDLKPILHNLVTCNSETGALDHWYESDDMYYATAGNLVVGAKKLTYNQWCCYLATNDEYKDYVIKALHKVTLK